MPDDANDSSSLGYLLPEEGYQRLQLARDYLLLLSRLAEPRSFHEVAADATPIPLGVWSVCLGQLTELITQSLDDAHWCRGN
jgi:hypothetical protein